MIGRSGNWQGGGVAAGVVCLLVILGLQLVLSVRRESQTWDEGDHIFAGYMSWEHADSGAHRGRGVEFHPAESEMGLRRSGASALSRGLFCASIPFLYSLPRLLVDV